MNLIKKMSTGVLICLILSGCAFFAVAGKKLSEYCPGLNIKLSGVSIATNNGRAITIVQYDNSWQKKVTAYFNDKANGFAGDKSRKYLDIKDGDDRAVADGDSILTKAVTKGKTNAVVIYNVTTSRIIITEDH
jgi:hypothetical protein